MAQWHVDGKVAAFLQHFSNQSKRFTILHFLNIHAFIHSTAVTTMQARQEQLGAVFQYPYFLEYTQP